MEIKMEYGTVVRMLFGEMAKWHVPATYHDGCLRVAG